MSIADIHEVVETFIRKSVDAPYLEFIVGLVLLTSYIVAPFMRMITFEHTTGVGLYPLVVALVGMRFAKALEGRCNGKT